MEVKTIEYALGANNAFILFVVDTNLQKVFYQCVQEFFIENKEFYRKMNQTTINIRIPVFQNLSNGDETLQTWAKTVYYRQASGDVVRIAE